MNKIALAAAAVLTAGTFGLAAIAQDSNQSEFAKADGNKDGMVSFEEALIVNSTLTQAIFDQADENDDGSLDEAEFTGLQTLAGALGTEQSSQPSANSSSQASSSSTSAQ